MELKSIDVSKLMSAKNEELTAMADHFEIAYDPAAVNRGAIIAALKEKVAANKATIKNIKVVFHNAPDSPAEVFVQLNGNAFRYPKDTEVVVPAEILALISEAFEWKTETNGDGVKVRRRYQSQTYSIVND